MSELPLDNSFDLSKTKTAFPLVANDTYAKWRVEKVTVAENKLEGPANGRVHDGIGDYLTIEFSLVEPVSDTDGEQLLPGGVGSKFFDRTNLYAKADAKDPIWFVKRIAERIDALLGTSDADNKKGKSARPPINILDPNFGPQLAELIMGQILVAKMKVSTYEGTTRNEFAKVHFPGDLAA